MAEAGTNLNSITAAREDVGDTINANGGNASGGTETKDVRWEERITESYDEKASVPANTVPDLFAEVLAFAGNQGGPVGTDQLQALLKELLLQVPQESLAAAYPKLSEQFEILLSTHEDDVLGPLYQTPVKNKSPSSNYARIDRNRRRAPNSSPLSVKSRTTLLFLGGGAGGNVFWGKGKKDNKPVVVKEIRVFADTEDELDDKLRDTLKEVAILKQLGKHSCIAHYMDHSIYRGETKNIMRQEHHRIEPRQIPVAVPTFDPADRPMFFASPTAHRSNLDTELIGDSPIIGLNAHSIQGTKDICRDGGAEDGGDVNEKHDASPEKSQTSSFARNPSEDSGVITLDTRVTATPPLTGVVWIFLDPCGFGNLLQQYVRVGHLFARIPQTVRFMVQILEGVAYIHSHRIIHRDLKLENILINKEHFYRSPFPTIKIADFGLSYQLKDGEDTTIEEGAIGSHFFSSPEQLNKLEHGFASDVYSCGIMFYSMLIEESKDTGTVGSDDYMHKFKVMRTVKKPTSVWMKRLGDVGIQRRLFDLIMSMTSKIAAERPSVEEALEEAKALLAIVQKPQKELVKPKVDFVEDSDEEKESDESSVALDEDLAEENDEDSSSHEGSDEDEDSDEE